MSGLGDALSLGTRILRPGSTTATNALREGLINPGTRTPTAAGVAAGIGPDGVATGTSAPTQAQTDAANVAAGVATEVAPTDPLTQTANPAGGILNHTPTGGNTVTWLNANSLSDILG